MHRESEVISPETRELRKVYSTPALAPFIDRLLPRLEQLIESWSTEAVTRKEKAFSKTDSPRDQPSPMATEARSARVGAAISGDLLKKLLTNLAQSAASQQTADAGLQNLLQVNAASLQSLSSSPSQSRAHLPPADESEGVDAEIEAELEAFTVIGKTSETEAVKNKNLCFFKTGMSSSMH